MMSSEPPGVSEVRDRFHPTMDFELMNSFRLSGVLSDVTIMVNGIGFPSQKLVLAVNSSYFRATFAGKFESQAVHTLECDPSAFGAILNTRVSFHTGTGHIVPRLVTDLTDFFGENKEFSMILGKNWNFKVVFD